MTNIFPTNTRNKTQPDSTKPQTDGVAQYITNYLMYENGNFWYNLSCCDAAYPHSGILVSTKEQTVGTCESKVSADSTESLSFEAVIIGESRYRSSVTDFQGHFGQSYQAEPTGEHPAYTVEYYVKITAATGHDDLLNQTLKLISFKSKPDLFVAQIVNSGTVPSAHVKDGTLTVTYRNLPNPDRGKLVVTKLEVKTSSLTTKTYGLVFLSTHAS